MRDILVTLLVVLGVMYAFRKPYIGVLVWAWLGYMNPHRLSYGFAYGAPFVLITALITMFLVLFSNEKKSFPLTPVTAIWLLFILHMSIGTFFAVFPDEALMQLIKIYKIHLLIFVTLLVINTKEKINQLVWVITLSIGFFGIKGGIFTLSTGGAYLVWGPPGSHIADNNEIGLAVLAILPLFFYLKSQMTNKWIKRGILLAIILSVFSVFGTHSRGAFLGMGVMLFFLWLKMSNKFVTGFLGVIVVAIALAFMPAEFYERMGTIENYQEDASAMGRINAWTVAVNISNDRFFGGGFEHWSRLTFAQYAPVPDSVHDAHSIYFEVLGEHGYLGLLFFLLILLLTWTSSSWIIKHSKNVENLQWCHELSKMIQVSLVAYASGGAFLGLAYWDFPYHLMAIIVLMRKIVEKEIDSDKNKTKQVINKVKSGNDELVSEKKRWAWEK